MDVDQAHQPGYGFLSLPPGPIFAFSNSQWSPDSSKTTEKMGLKSEIPCVFWCFQIEWSLETTTFFQHNLTQHDHITNSSIKSSVFFLNISTVAGFFRRCSSSYILGVSCPEKPWFFFMPKKTWDPSGDTQRWWKGRVSIGITYL